MGGYTFQICRNTEEAAQGGCSDVFTLYPDVSPNLLKVPCWNIWFFKALLIRQLNKTARNTLKTESSLLRFTHSTVFSTHTHTHTHVYCHNDPSASLRPSFITPIIPPSITHTLPLHHISLHTPPPSLRLRYFQFLLFLQPPSVDPPGSQL